MKTGNPYLFLAKAVLSYCLVFLPGVFLWSQQITDLNKNYCGKTIQTDCPAWVSANNNTHSKLPGVSLFLLEWVSEESETPEEVDNGDDAGFEWNAILPVSVAEVNLYVNPLRNLFTQLNEAVQSRPVVSLFVLHHSWKSFLV